MKPPSDPTEPEPYLEQSISSGGAQPSAKAIFQQRKNYAKTVASQGEVSEYKVEVNNLYMFKLYCYNFLLICML